ncbi:MAG: winged helix-turn-helix domain-containing protein, partial [Chloroflexota bacterium]
RATVADLAQLTGRSQPSLYHHLRIMATHRLVGQEVERRAGRPVRVFVYDASVNRRVVDAKTGQGIKELGTLAGAMLREVGTRVRRWATVHDRRPIRTGADADAILVTELAWFTPRERARAIRHLHALIRLARSTHGRRRGERFCMTLLQFRDYTVREARQERAGSRK